MRWGFVAARGDVLHFDGTAERAVSASVAADYEAEYAGGDKDEENEDGDDNGGNFRRLGESMAGGRG